jgi:hypothetical protein
VAFGILAGVPWSAGYAQDDDNTRAVRIIEGAGPSSPAPANVPAPALVPPQPGPPAAVQPPPVNYAALNTAIKADNAAGLKLEMLPGTDLSVGTRIVFRISTRKPGYLILLDVDANGKLTQIFPNPLSTMRGATGSNLIKPDRPLTLPDSGGSFAGYEFVAEPPTGVAMLVALLSDQPVQIVDLPDVPGSFVGRADAFNHVYEIARSLRIVGGEGNALPRPVNWSVDAKYYAIR